METLKVKIAPEELQTEALRGQARAIMAAMGEIIKKGGLVAFPTETVYGLGANALNGEAVLKIFQAKGRPSDNPLIVHIAEKSELRGLIDPSVSLSVHSQQLINKFWPGPLTLVFPASGRIPKEVSAGLDTVALRMPQHPIALELIKAAGVPLAAPSANLSGKPSPISAEHVIQDLDGKIEAVIDGGSVEVGVESTVLDLTTEPPTLLRPGGITLEALEAVLGKVQIDPAITKEGFATGLTPRSPGMKYLHYAPEARLILVEGEAEAIGQKVKDLAATYEKENYRVGILASEENMYNYVSLNSAPIITAGSRRDLKAIAAGLYGFLRKFDQLGVDIILAEGYTTKGEGLAIMNRLRKAAGYNIVQAE